MRRWGLRFTTLMIAILAACGGDTTISPSDRSVPGSTGSTPQAVTPAVATSCSVADITGDLTTLMSALTPNENSTLGKFQYVQTLMAYNNPDSTAKARDFTVNTLISFINIKYSQASPSDQATYAALLAKVQSELLCFVGMFSIPTTNTPKAFALPNGMGGVWFPPDFCDGTCPGINVALDQVLACTLPGVPAGCVQDPLKTLLDKYGIYLKIALSGGTPNPNSALPVVALCAPSETDPLVLPGLRVGHQHTGTGNPAGFDILALVGIPTDLQALLSCPSYGAMNSGTGSPTVLGQMISRLATLLLPEKLSARPTFLTAGFGGSTRTFSPFGLIDIGLSATGGVGGSKSSFSPANPDAAPSAPALATDANGNLVDVAGTIQKTSLPGVYVKTGLGTAIPGATVTFSMTNPISTNPPYNQTPSQASVCDVNEASQSQITVTTDINGFAQLGCVRFGTLAGYKNLKAVVDPSTASGLGGGGLDNVTVTACDPNCGAPGSTTTLNWLVTTQPAAAAKLTIESIATTAAAGAAFSPQPVIKVRDLYDNVVTTSTAVVTPSATGPAGSTGGLINTNPPDVVAGVAAVAGVATFSYLGIGGTVGSWNVSFGSPGLTSASASVAITAGAAATIRTYMPPSAPVSAAEYTYPGLATSGTAISPSPQARVRDAYGNPVVGQAISWQAVNSTISVGGATTTGTGGLAQVTSWTPGTGESSLLASVSGIADPAVFFAATALGNPVFLCELGDDDKNFLTVGNSNTNKTDLAPIKVSDPRDNVVDLFFYMSVTGQSNSFSSYPVDVKVYRTSGSATSPGTTQVGAATGAMVALPGNNGKPQFQHIKLTSPVLKSTGNNLLWFVITMVNPPSGRTFQLWYNNLASNKLTSACKASYIGTGNSPTQGAALMLKN